VVMEQPASEKSMADLAGSSAQTGESLEPLRLVVPTAGIHFAFEKLYANQGKDDVGFEIPYATGIGGTLGRSGVLIGTLLAWIGLALLRRGYRRIGPSLIAGGILLVLALASRYEVGLGSALTLSVVIAILVGGVTLWRSRAARPQRDED